MSMVAAFPEGSSFTKGHGILVSPDVQHRMEERHKRIIAANADHIQAKTVLDLASNNGRWSFAALQAGASFVFGIEGRQILIDRGLPDFASIDPSRFRFACGDIYDMHEIVRPYGIARFDTILCLGIFYHISDHYRLFRLMRRFNPTAIIIDSSFLKTDESTVRFRNEDSHDPSMGIAEHTEQVSVISGIASIGFLRQMAKISGYEVTFVQWHRAETDYPAVVQDYLDTSKPSQRFTVRLTASSNKPVW